MAAVPRKVGLDPGRGLNDWIRLLKTQTNSSKPRAISLKELAEHGVGVGTTACIDSNFGQDPTKGDIWMALGGKVYDVTKYIAYHPGGREELLRGAGADATDIFLQVRMRQVLCSSHEGSRLGAG